MAIRFTGEQKQEIERLALINCNSNTIAEATGIAVTTLKRRFGRKIRHYHALYRVNLRESQDKLKETSPDLSKFLGKNELGQVDKHIEVKESQQRELDEAEKAECIKIAAWRNKHGVA